MTSLHPDGELLAGYATGSADRVSAWSVEAHLTECAPCRAEVSAHVEPTRLARNRQVLLVRVATTDAGRPARLLSRCGVPDHLLRLLAATPSLRWSWLLSVIGAITAVSAEAAFAAHLAGGPAGPAYAHGQALLPFVLAAPLVVLAAVSGAFLPTFDPTYRLAVAAPLSAFTLLLTRTVCALASALVPVVVAAFVVPGPGWLPAALLLPSLALSALALAAAAVLGPRAAAIVAAVVWVAPVLWVAAVRSPLVVLHWHGQFACAAVVGCAVAVLALRRDRLEIGWTR